MYRPGGSALNETQVGSLRAAMHIIHHGGLEKNESEEAFLNAAQDDLARETAYFSRTTSDARAAKVLSQVRADMDAYAGAMRDLDRMRAMAARVQGYLDENIAGSTPEETAELRDTLLVQRAALSAMLCQAQFAGEAGHGFVQRSVEKDAPDAKNFAFETRGDQTRAVALRPLPQGGGWFETVWRRYLSDEVYG